MAPKTEDTRPTAMSQDEFTAMLTTQMKGAVRLTLVTILEAEIPALIGALPHERSVTRTDRRNGHYARDLSTTMGHIEDLAVPRTRGGHQTQLFERYSRRRPEVDAAISGMFIKGVSPRGVGEVMESLTGSAPSPSTVSRVFHTLWRVSMRHGRAVLSRPDTNTCSPTSRQRGQAHVSAGPLSPRYEYIFADGTYFTVSTPVRGTISSGASPPFLWERNVFSV